jgi:thymidylate kinase
MNQFKFYVLLAIDGAGKSTLMDTISNSTNWELVTYDEDYVPNKYKIIAEIDKMMEKETLQFFPSLSKDFKSSIYSSYIYYLEDVVNRKRESSNVICNSYYYKILGKELVMDGENQKFHKYWRELPKPDKIIFLDTPPEIAYKRTPAPSKLFRNEYYGNKPTLDNFVAFQKDLREKMLGEIEGIPTEFLDGKKSVSELNKKLETILNGND